MYPLTVFACDARFPRTHIVAAATIVPLALTFVVGTSSGGASSDPTYSDGATVAPRPSPRRTATGPARSAGCTSPG
jgi:hypothetical protein